MQTFESEIENGITVRDRISGFTGVVTGQVFYISGCNQSVVQPKASADGKVEDARWFDNQRLEQVGEAKIELDNGATPGFGETPPTR